jgi:iron(III) transport system permease protein
MNRSNLISQHAILGLTAFVVLSPLFPLFYQALLDGPIYAPGSAPTLDNFISLLGDPEFHRASLNSVVFAAICTVVASLIGVSAAILIMRTDLPFRRLFGGLFLVPLFTSHLVLAIGFYSIYGPTGYMTLWAKAGLGFAPWNFYTLSGMAVVGGLAQAPLAYLFCIAASRTADPSLEDAALTAGASPWRVLVTITLPLLSPAILYGLSINFVFGIEMLSIPLIFGTSNRIELFSTFIYKSIMSSTIPDHGVVGVAAFLLLIVVVLLLWGQRLMERHMERFVTVSGKSTRPKPFRLKQLKWPLMILMLAYVAVAVVLPIGGLILRSFAEIFTPLLPLHEVLTLANYKTAFNDPIVRRSIGNTVYVATLTAGIGTLLVFLICVVSYRSNYRGANLLATIAQVPRAVPGVFAGVAVLYLVLFVPPLGWIRNTPYILVFAYMTRFIPIGAGAIQPALQQIGTELDKSARVTGASWWRANFTILLPILKPALFACFTLIFIHALKGSEVIGSTLLQAWEEGQQGLTAALSTILILLTAVILAVSRWLFGVKLYDQSDRS